jgi:hypothetical protein
MQNDNDSPPVSREVPTSPPRNSMRPRRVECQRSLSAPGINPDSSPAAERSRSLALGRAVKQAVRYAKRLAVTR